MASNNDNVVKVKQIVSSDGVSHDIAAKSLLTTDGTEVTKEDIYSAIGAKEDSSNKTTSIVDSNLSDTKFPSEKATATYVQGKTSPLETDVAAIKGKIPTQASTTNQLADKDFVNSSINSVAAYYITKNAAGDPFATKAELNAATTYYSGGQTRVPTKNDYCLVNADETHDNAAVRYLYTTQWEYQYKVNDTPFTSAQLAAINSGITSTLVGDISSNSSARHTHSNKSLLDSYNQTNTDLSDAVSKKHEHSNKSILDNTTASYTTADQTKLGGIEAGAQVNPTSLPANGGNSDTVDNKHASDFVKYGGNQSGIGSNSPVTGAQDWATAANLPNGNALVYNSSGKEYSMLFSLHPTTRNYGSILRWGYEDKYLYITRKEGNVWKDSTDWEKISAGYADSAGTAGSANAVAWSNVSGKPSFATVATSGSYTDLSNKPTIPSKTSDLTNDSDFATETWVGNNYLGKTAKASDSSKLNGQSDTYYLDYDNFTNTPTIPTYNFDGTTFYSGNSDNAEHNANNATANGHYYYTSNGPSNLGESTTDGALYVQSYSSSWVGQIAQDYRNGRLWVRGKNNGTWQEWKRIAQTGESQPASDVYDWAKASTKPSYTHDEIGAGDLTIGDGANELYWRTNDSWRSGVYYHTTGNEAVVFANTNSSTSWIFATTDPSSRLDWNTGLTSAVSMQIKNKCVAINKHIASGTTPSYNLDVNGNGRFSDTLTLEKNSVATTLGSENSGFFHIITRNSSGSSIPTYFGQGVSVDGNISLYGTDYYFHSDGNLNANLIKINNKMTMQYNTTEDCIEFVFA